MSAPHKGGSPLPLPIPPKLDKSSLPATEGGKAYVDARPHPWEDRWKSLRPQHRAQGLCQFCAKKWSKGHTCANKIQLHAVQEMWEAFQLSEDTSSLQGDVNNVDQQLFLTLSLAGFGSAIS